MRRVPPGILETLRRGAEEIKAEVDKDNEGGFPLVNAGILGFIALVLYLIWDKLNERLDPTSSSKKQHSSSFGGGSSPSIFSSSGPGYMFGGGKGKEY